MAGLFAALSFVVMMLPEVYKDGLGHSLRATVLRPFIAVQRGAADRQGRYADASSLRAERDSLASFLVGQATMAAENRQLRQLLGFRERLTYSFKAAEARPEAGPGSEGVLRLSAGARDGVRPGAPVITAEAVKIQIGSAYSTGDEREMDVKGRDLVSGIPKTVRVHSQEIRECIQEPIQAIVEAVRRALEITPPELASDIVDRGIVMTGGGALIRGLDTLIARETNLPIHVDEDPLTCVVRGAGRILDDVVKYRGVLTN
ncbi:MAG TPA: rod shape-determining protein [Thermoleophilaceae bacterium]|nr:rod shape-determining protein [Thermoleophilaceae bacterium]